METYSRVMVEIFGCGGRAGRGAEETCSVQFPIQLRSILWIFHTSAGSDSSTLPLNNDGQSPSSPPHSFSLPPNTNQRTAPSGPGTQCTSEGMRCCNSRAACRHTLPEGATRHRSSCESCRNARCTHSSPDSADSSTTGTSNSLKSTDLGSTPSIRSGIEVTGDNRSSLETADSAFPLDGLPESVLPNVFKHLSPLDLISVTAVSRTFHSACQLDVVWRCHLPPWTQVALESAWPNPLSSQSSFDCARRLSTGIFLDKGRQRLKLDVQTKVLTVGIGMSEASRTQVGTIMRGASRQEWVRLQDLPDAWFSTSVLLKHIGGYVSRIENIPMLQLLPPGRYGIGWRIRGASKAASLPLSVTLSATVTEEKPSFPRTGMSHTRDNEEDHPPLCQLQRDVCVTLPLSWIFLPIGMIDLPPQAGQDSIFKLTAAFAQQRQREQPAVNIDCLMLTQMFE